VPPSLWSGAAHRYRRWCTAADEAIARLVGGALALLPDGTRLAIARRLELRRPLDYRRARIWLRVTSAVERRVRLYSCEKEPETVAWLEATLRPDDVLYDIGANVGAYALVAAKIHAGVRVYAFEPGQRTFANLVENIALNDASQQIVPLPVALTDRTTLVKFQYASMEAGAALHPGLRGTERKDGGAGTHVVLGFRLDDLNRHLALPRPTHMKVDVDGAELEVLRGGLELLDSPCLRTIMLETELATQDGRAVHALLVERGFQLVQATPLSDHEANCLYQRADTPVPVPSGAGGAVLEPGA
jgi:FkbM family methyltransferase